MSYVFGADFDEMLSENERKIRNAKKTVRKRRLEKKEKKEKNGKGTTLGSEL